MSRPEWNENEYVSITGPFLLKSGKEGKVNQIITAQSMLANIYSRDSLLAITTWGKSVTWFMQTSPSVNLKYE